MRTFRTSLVLVLTVLFTSVHSHGMSVEQSRNEAWFLTDKMDHELRLNNYQWDDVYEVNYDFFRSLGHVTTSYTSAERLRDQKLMYILTAAQWREYSRLSYFTNPVVVYNGNWTFSIYRHYNRNTFFNRNHNVVYTYTGNRNGWQNYYSGRHVTQSTSYNSGYNYNYNSNSRSNGNSSVSRPSTRTPLTTNSRVTTSNSNNNGSGHVTQGSSTRVTQNSGNTRVTQTNSNSRRH